MKHRILTALALMAGLSSCTEYQEIIVKTDPSLADCTLDRDGIPIAHLTPTPGAVYIPMSRDTLTITCSKPGYRTASISNSSDVNNNNYFEYDSPVTLVLPKEETPE